MIRLQGPSYIITGDEVIPVVREDQVIYLEGKPVKRELAEFFIVCNVQPMDGRDLLLVPEADRFKEQYTLFTNNVQTPLMDNDRIVRGGINFQCQNVENWGSYQKCRIMRIDVGPYVNSR